jgi:peptide/nickel transport system ATP-binding protein
MTLPILAFNEFTFEFETKPPTAPVVRRLTLSIGPGETLAVVGESGSGKSTMAYNAMGDLGVTGRLINGNIEVSGIDLVDLTPGELRKLRGGQVAMVPQDPMTNLSPSVRVGRQLEEVLFFHSSLKQGRAMDEAVRAALQMVELHETERILRSYPHELSGGQQQRVLISLALISKP